MGDYDVFLNHHGPDTKYGFISHLGTALTNERLKPFVDLPSLKEEAGFHVSTIIRNALEVVKVNVAVVSKGYASSEYCLDELVIMMKSNKEVQKPIIPVFFDVHFNDDLRWRSHKSGLFAGAFQDHLRFREQDIVTQWAVALDELANISGFSKANYQGEAALIADVVACVKKHMEKRAYKSSATQSYYGAVEHEFRESNRCGEMLMYNFIPLAHQPTKNLLEYSKSLKSHTSKSVSFKSLQSF